MSCTPRSFCACLPSPEKSGPFQTRCSVHFCSVAFQTYDWEQLRYVVVELDFFSKKKAPSETEIILFGSNTKGVMILDCVCMCLEVDHVIKMCINMAGINSVTSITWKRSIDEKCPNFFLRLYFRTRGALISKFRVENLGHFETPTTKTVILTYCENNSYQITYLPKNYLWTKNEGNRFFNSCHSMLHISWPSLLKLHCR